MSMVRKPSCGILGSIDIQCFPILKQQRTYHTAFLPNVYYRFLLTPSPLIPFTRSNPETIAILTPQSLFS